MATVLRPAQAGTVESGDILITVAPGAMGSGIVIELESIVMAQYGRAIRETLITTVEDEGVSDLFIKAVDRGALDCTIRARMQATLRRAGALLGTEARL